MEKNIILQGESLEVLKTLPSESVDCVVTSPPYWALRSYLADDNPDKHKELGLEEDFNEYINKLCDIFDEVKRVLKKTGTCWVNIADTYNAGGNYRGKELGDGSKEIYRRKDFQGCQNDKNAQGIQPKSLCNIPARFSIEMQKRGWILRNEIIWYKRNCMPTSTTDRFTVDFEKIFFFVKSQKYFFEQQFNELNMDSVKRALRGRESEKLDNGQYSTSYKKEYEGYENIQERIENNDIRGINTKGSNMRCVWDITTKGFDGAHFAVYPLELIRTPIKAGCPIGGITLDPFMGSGTTAIVCLEQNKDFIGIELNKDFIKIANDRISKYKEKKQIYDDGNRGLDKWL